MGLSPIIVDVYFYRFWPGFSGFGKTL